MSSRGGPKDNRTKWWHGELNRLRRWFGSTSKKTCRLQREKTWVGRCALLPGMTIVFSLINSSKNVCRSHMRKSQVLLVRTYQAVVQGRWQTLQIEPYIECGLGVDMDFQSKFFQAV